MAKIHKALIDFTGYEKILYELIHYYGERQYAPRLSQISLGHAILTEILPNWAKTQEESRLAKEKSEKELKQTQMLDTMDVDLIVSYVKRNPGIRLRILDHHD